MGLQELDSDRAARISALVEECRPLLHAEAGMAAVQKLLSDRRVSVIDSILVTRELLGAGPSTLGEAKSMVLCSPSRSMERRRHQELTSALIVAVDQLFEEG
ncbi:hypothetical protein ACSDR0_48160 [Streptosporangium sp. G11]|uniref:hypothetical protein n=1 Tax=Streptosporangium sp. G11 TaxID=3436926 RepID=UPI003EC01C2F